MTPGRSTRLPYFLTLASSACRVGRTSWCRLELVAIPLVVIGFARTTAAQSYQWHTNPANGHRYAFTASMTWTQAQATAQANGGNLATVRSAAEDIWISQTFGSGPYWIGFTDHQLEGAWVWISGEATQFTNWCARQPDDNCDGRSEDYAHVWGQPPCNTGKWNDNTDDGCSGVPGLMPGVMELMPAANYTTYRLSCDSSAGTPALSNTTLPLVGTTLRLIATGLGPNKLGYIFFGLTDEIWGLNLLPLDLTSIGAAGCFLNITPVQDYFVPTDASGTARPVFSIPNDSAMLGVVFFNQYVTLDDAPPGRPLRICTTNAGRGVIGI